MKAIKTILGLFFTVITLCAMAQGPVINSITPDKSFPGSRLIITGSGFSSNTSQLQVWFGQVKGTINSSTELSINVTIPASARYDVIEVINLTTRLSTRSADKFSPYYSGSSFDAAKLGAPLTFAGTTEQFDLCSCDLNADNKPDYVATQFDLQTDLIVFQNTSVPGTIAFNRLDKTNLASLNVGAPTEIVTCADLNGDGKPEVIASRGGATKNSVFVLPNTSAGTISFGATISLFLDVGHFARFVKVRDLNGDGKPEIIVSNSFNNQLYIFQNQSSGGILSINPTPVKLTITGASTTYGLDAQDLDNDGLADLIINQFQSNNFYILRNLGGLFNFSSPINVVANGTLNEVVTADINDDNLLDLIATNTLNNQLLVLLNNTSGSNISFGTPTILNTSNGPWGVDVGDIDGDQDIDIIVANRNQAFVNVFRHNGNFAAPAFSKIDIASSNPTRNIVMSDIDGDAKPDIAFSSFNTNTNSFKVEFLRNENCFVPVILNEAPLTICATQTIRLNTIAAIGISNFEWKKDGVTQSNTVNPFFDITVAGNYTVTATGEGGSCTIESSGLNVTTGTGSVPADPVVSSNSPVCSGQNIQLGTTSTGVTYNWSGPNNFTSGVQNPVITTAGIANAGQYTLKVSDGTCSSNEVSVVVDVADLDNFTITSPVASNTICQGSSLTLTVGAASGHQYQWIKDGVDIGGQVGVNLVVTQQGIYKNRVQNISLGCSAETNEITVTVLAPPVSSFTVASTACVDEILDFTNQSVSDSRAVPVYDWDFGDGDNASDQNTTHSYATAQQFSPSLTLSYEGVNNCSNTSSEIVEVVNAVQPAIVASSPASCPGDQITLEVAVGFASLLWSTNETGTSIVVNQPGQYSVVSVDANGCTGNGIIDILSNPVPELVVTADKTSIISGQSAQLDVTGADSYSWLPSETLDDPTSASPIATPDQTTTYTVTGSVTDGCNSSATITITVNTDPSALDIPNVFSPNGDGINDLWVIPGVEAFTECIMTIFDRTGKRVYERRGYLNDWDGTYNGKAVPSGTYYFVLGCPDSEPFTGHLLIGR